ncbi:MAG: hypothetical protein LBC75_00825 [Fibromonadaceae bacterium]|nr:hypothetical protein [Fibromonadaceae bacterium]
MKTNRTRTRNLEKNEAQRLLMRRKRRETEFILNEHILPADDNWTASLLKKFMKFQIFQDLLNACEIAMLEKGENPLLLNKKKLILNISFSDSIDIANESNGCDINNDNSENSSNEMLPPDVWEENREEEFRVYWIIYPEKGRIERETCKQIFKKMRETKNFPRPADFYGIVRYYMNNIWNNVIPKLSEFLNEADWRNMNAEDKLKIARNRENNKREVERLVNEYNGIDEVQTNMPQPNKQEQQNEPEPLPISDKVPTAEEIESMPIKRQAELAVENRYGLPVSIFIDAVRRRDKEKLLKENTNNSMEGIRNGNE